MKNNKNFYIVLLILLLVVLFSCKKEPSKISFSGKAQGTFYNITYFDKKNRNFQKAIDSILDEFNLTASMYEPQSILSRINNNDTSVILNEDFISIFNIANEVSEKTNGAFDVTVCPLVNAWGFGFKNIENVDSNLINNLRKYVGYKMIWIKNKKFYKKYPEIQIDFNAIAQGYSVDKIANFLEKQNITNYIVEIGGEVKANGKKPDNSSWIVGIDKPDDNIGYQHNLKAKVKLDNMSVATSGNYRKYYIKNGIKYSHTIDPTTGYPVNHSLLSASVFHKSCTIADAYATAFMVMGIKKTIEFLKSHPELEAYLIYADDKGNTKTFITKGLCSILIEENSSKD